MNILNKIGGRFVLLIFFLNLPTCLSEIFTQELGIRVIRHFFSYAMFTIFLATIIAIIIFVLERANRFVAEVFKCVILIICAGIFLADIFTVYYYDTTVNRSILGIIIATNFDEAAEFFIAYVFNVKFLICVALTMLILIALSKVKLPHVNRKLLAVIAVAVIAVTVTRLIKVPDVVFEKGNAVTRLAVLLPEVLANMREYENLAASANHEVTITRNAGDLPLVVFILGESTTRNHMQLYGYNLPTTPRLVELHSRGELNIFTDTISPHSHTMPVLQKLFTFLRHENEADGNAFWMRKGNLFDILNAAGYDTVWLSNQEISGIYGNFGRLYAATCTRSKFTRLRDSTEESNAKFDEAVLPLFDDELATIHEKTFCVIHLMGTHSVYNRRYPKQYETFTSDDESSAAGRDIRAEYDNAVLYNDYVVSEIIKRVENLDAIVIYISDHGEDVYDEMNFAGHAEDSPSRFMIEIPFVIWTSEKFREHHSDVEQKISAAVNQPFMTDDMIHLLMDMLKVETADFDARLSPLNPNYNSERQRIYGGKIYDKGNGLH